MQLHSLKLVTIITESVIAEQVCDKARELGSTGYTLTEATGFGSRGARHDGPAINTRIEFVCPEPVAVAILTHISRQHYDYYATIAWMTDVTVVRGANYDTTRD